MIRPSSLPPSHSGLRLYLVLSGSPVILTSQNRVPGICFLILLMLLLSHPRSVRLSLLHGSPFVLTDALNWSIPRNQHCPLSRQIPGAPSSGFITSILRPHFAVSLGRTQIPNHPLSRRSTWRETCLALPWWNPCVRMFAKSIGMRPASPLSMALLRTCLITLFARSFENSMSLTGGMSSLRLIMLLPQPSGRNLMPTSIAQPSLQRSFYHLIVLSFGMSPSPLSLPPFVLNPILDASQPSATCVPSCLIGSIALSQLRMASPRRPLHSLRHLRLPNWSARFFVSIVNPSLTSLAGHPSFLVVCPWFSYEILVIVVKPGWIGAFAYM